MSDDIAPKDKRTDRFGRFTPRVEELLIRYMSVEARECDNSTQLAENAASYFDLYADSNYTIDDRVFELALKYYPEE